MNCAQKLNFPHQSRQNLSKLFHLDIVMHEHHSQFQIFTFYFLQLRVAPENLFAYNMSLVAYVLSAILVGDGSLAMDDSPDRNRCEIGPFPIRICYFRINDDYLEICCFASNRDCFWSKRNSVDDDKSEVKLCKYLFKVLKLERKRRFQSCFSTLGHLVRS